MPVVAKYFAVSFHHLKQGGEGERGRGGGEGKGGGGENKWDGECWHGEKYREEAYEMVCTHTHTHAHAHAHTHTHTHTHTHKHTHKHMIHRKQTWCALFFRVSKREPAAKVSICASVFVLLYQ